MINRKYFRFVDALEETIDLWHYGKNILDAPTYNTYVPVRHTIMPKPDLRHDAEGELGFRFNNPADKESGRVKLNPLAPLSPLSGYEMGPRIHREREMFKDFYEVRPKYLKWRKLSTNHRRRKFSTVTKSYSKIPVTQGFSPLSPFKSYFTKFRQE